MTDVNSAQIVSVRAGLTLAITTDALSSGLIRRVSSIGSVNLTGNRISNLPVSSALSIGPFPTDRTYSIEPVTGHISYSLDVASYNYATDRGNVESFVGSFTLKNEDMGKVFRCDDGSNVTITVPNYLAQGFNCGFIMYAAGNIALSFAVGATNRSGKTTITILYNRGSLFVAKQVTTNDAAEILVGGDFA